MARADHIYRFISNVWDGLPQKEKNRFGELWKGYEQVFADVFQHFLELDLSVNVNSMPVFLTSRWNKYTFNTDNQRLLPATFISQQDLSQPLDLGARYLFKFSIDQGTPIELDLRGLITAETVIDEIVAKINIAAGFTFATTIFENTIIQLQTQTTGPTARIDFFEASNPTADAFEIVFGITLTELPFNVPRLPYTYTIPDSKIRKIPSLQNSIRNENLERFFMDGPDFITNFSLGQFEFREEPNETLWAKVTFLEEEQPFYNFGYLIDYRDTTVTSERYLQNLQGLWFAYWQGPRPEYIKQSLYLLFGLPVAVENGIVLTKSDTVLEILHSDSKIRAYALPAELSFVVNIGDFVEKFEPLVNGIDIFDKSNLPGFVQTEVGRGGIRAFALDEATQGFGEDTDETKALTALEEHTFLPQIGVEAFVQPDISIASVFKFLNNIRPLQKEFYFEIIVGKFKEELALRDSFGFDFDFDITPNLEINQANQSTEEIREDYETNIITDLDIDSDVLGIFERGSISVADISGPRPEFDVVFD